MADPPAKPARAAWQRWWLALTARPAVRVGRRVYQRYASADGPLLAGGLAYSALFAVVPAVVLALGASAVLLGQGPDRSAVVAAAGRVFPPLRDLLRPVADELARQSTSITLLGVVGFAWGASRFTIALQSALALIFGSDTRRGAVGRELLALASVALLVAVVIAGTLLAGLASVVEGVVVAGIGELASPILSFVLGIAGPLVGVLALAVVYRFVPPSRPAWRAALPPAIVVGTVLALGTRLFVLLAPRLIGAAAVFGTLATAFVALAWFGATFQALLIGAAWVGDRALQARSPAG